jgi:hypothetical protein
VSTGGQKSVFGSTVWQACPLFASRQFCSGGGKGPKDTRRTHRARDSILWRPRRTHTVSPPAEESDNRKEEGWLKAAARQGAHVLNRI